MKPPFRQRTEPSRLKKSIEQERTERSKGLFKGWSRKDLQSFLQALKQQKNFYSELDLTEIQKKVSHRSLKEIEDLIKILKSRLLRKVYLQVHSQRREERRAKVPIEIWEELVQKISRSHEKTISLAFSQMLVIAAAEPCVLMNSEPPHPIVHTPAFSSLLPVPPPEAPTWISTSGTSPKSSVPTTSAPSLLQPESGSNTDDQISRLVSVPSSSASVPQTPTTSQTEKLPNLQQSEAEAAASRPASSDPAASPVSSNKTITPLELVDHDYQCKPRMMKSVMNFNKIYQYLSGVDSKTCTSSLTSIESAVLLDVLLSLPEELPLLDCTELQHHLLQTHTRLSVPAVKPAVSFASTHTAAEPCASADPERAEGEWAAAGTRPLNPLLVPAGLLKRRSVDSGK